MAVSVQLDGLQTLGLTPTFLAVPYLRSPGSETWPEKQRWQQRRQRRQRRNTRRKNFGTQQMLPAATWLLKRLLSCGYDGFLSALTFTYGPMAGPLLCMPREQVQGRVHNIVSGAAMVYGLTLSGVASSALSPSAAEDSPSSFPRTCAHTPCFSS